MNAIKPPGVAIPTVWSGPFKYRCHTCRDSGAVLATLKSAGGAPYAYQCHCDQGDFRNRRYPLWDERLSEWMEVVR